MLNETVKRIEQLPEPSSTQKVEQNYSKKRVGEGDVQIDEDKLARAVQEERKRKGKGDDDRFNKKARSGLESSSHDVTEEEMGTLSTLFDNFYSQHSQRRTG